MLLTHCWTIWCKIRLVCKSQWVHITSSHYDDIIMSAIASQITSLAMVYSTVYSDADQRKHQSSASLAFVWGIHRGPVNSHHKWPLTRKMFPFDDVIMSLSHSDSSDEFTWHEYKGLLRNNPYVSDRPNGVHLTDRTTTTINRFIWFIA